MLLLRLDIMNELHALVVHYGYIIIFLIVLAEALGIPVPAALALVIGGAAVASGALRPSAAVLTAVMAMLVGDSLLYLRPRQHRKRVHEECGQNSADTY